MLEFIKDKLIRTSIYNINQQTARVVAEIDLKGVPPHLTVMERSYMREISWKRWPLQILEMFSEEGRKENNLKGG